MKLLCISSYRCRERIYEPGNIIEATDAEAAVLLSDSPGSFVVHQPVAVVTTDVAAPPADTMVKTAPKRKDI